MHYSLYHYRSSVKHSRSIAANMPKIGEFEIRLVVLPRFYSSTHVTIRFLYVFLLARSLAFGSEPQKVTPPAQNRDRPPGSTVSTLTVPQQHSQLDARPRKASNRKFVKVID